MFEKIVTQPNLDTYGNYRESLRFALLPTLVMDGKTLKLIWMKFYYAKEFCIQGIEIKNKWIVVSKSLRKGN
jgi:hypothetical protein